MLNRHSYTRTLIGGYIRTDTSESGHNGVLELQDDIHHTNTDQRRVIDRA